MYRNLYLIGGGCLALAVIFLACFQRSARGRADFVWNNGTEPQTLDTGLMSGQPEGDLAIGLFEGLTIYHPQTLEPVPGVARNWRIDGLKYVFELRPDAWWVKGDEIYAVDGKPRRVTAEDFVYAWRRHFLPETGSEYSYLLHLIAGAREYQDKVAEHWDTLVQRYQREKPGITVTRPSSLDPVERAELERFRTELWDRTVGVRANGDLELEVTLESPALYFLALTNFYPFFPVPREAIEEHGDEWVLPGNIVSNGPYRLAEWKFNSFVRLAKNAHYWETANYAATRMRELEGRESLAPFERRDLDLLNQFGAFGERGLETMEALAIEERNTSLNLYINGDIDRDREIPSDVAGDLIAELSREGSDFRQVHHGVGMQVYFYNVNTTLAVFQGETGRKLRRAMSLAVDRRGLIDAVTRAHQKPAYRLVPPGIAGYPGEPLFGSSRAEDLAEAKRLVAEVRGEGVKLPTLRLLYNTHEGHAKIAAFLQNGWKRDLGIETTLANQEWGVFLDSRRNGAFDLARSGWIADYPDPNTFLDMFTTGNQNNDPKYQNAHYDRLINEYGARILEMLATGESRKKALADIESWPAWKVVAGSRSRSDGRTLEQAVREALRAEPPTEGNARLDHAARTRLLLMEAAEEMLIHDMPIIPCYFYTQTQVWPPELEGMYLNARDVHPLKFLRWQGGTRPPGSRYRYFPRISTRARLVTAGERAAERAGADP